LGSGSRTIAGGDAVGAGRAPETEVAEISGEAIAAVVGVVFGVIATTGKDGADVATVTVVVVVVVVVVTSTGGVVPGAAATLVVAVTTDEWEGTRGGDMFVGGAASASEDAAAGVFRPPAAWASADAASASCKGSEMGKSRAVGL
jgi:hypothetical protein